jgi:hypothetical protein
VRRIEFPLFGRKAVEERALGRRELCESLREHPGARLRAMREACGECGVFQ